ncbi:MAG: ion transporter [Gammaproteobacteria bacterium]|nr:ion transporter [Gammaproteobacteria bacterium]
MNAADSTPNNASKNWHARLFTAREKLRAQLKLGDRDMSLFEWVTVAVIILSSMTIGMKTYNLPPLLLLVLEVMDDAIMIYFVVEILTRLAVEKPMRNFFKSGWNIFDACIVTVSTIPLDESEYVLLGRLLRLFRMMRLIVFLPELRKLIESLLHAIPRVFYVLLLMFIVFYIYGAFGSLIFADINPALWGNIGAAMLTMFRVATLEDWTDVMYETMEIHPFSWIFYLSFIGLITFIMLNMIVAVIIEVVQEHAKLKADKSANKTAESTAQRLTRIENDLTAIRRKLQIADDG